MEATETVVSIWKKPITKWVIGIGGFLALVVGYKYFTREKSVDLPTLPKSTTPDTPIAKATTIPEQTAENLAPDLLPNNGVGCSPLRTNYDMDFNYVKCKGIWYTKLKINPRGKYDSRLNEWKSLEGNKVAIDRLNIKYPND